MTIWLRRHFSQIELTNLKSFIPTIFSQCRKYQHNEKKHANNYTEFNIFTQFLKKKKYEDPQTHIFLEGEFPFNYHFALVSDY